MKYKCNWWTTIKTDQRTPTQNSNRRFQFFWGSTGRKLETIFEYI